MPAWTRTWPWTTMVTSTPGATTATASWVWALPPPT